MVTVMMVCGSGHHWGALIENLDTFEARVAIQDKEVLCPRCGEIFVQCRDFYTGKRWPNKAGPSAMNHVFCHHPSIINGRGQRCPDCNAEPESKRSSYLIDDSTMGVWADSLMKRWGDTSAVRITED